MSAPLDPLRKTAILLAALDAPSADALIDQMPSHMARQVRDKLLDLDGVDPAEQQAVIDEFLRQGGRLASQGAARQPPHAPAPVLSSLDGGVQLEGNVAIAPAQPPLDAPATYGPAASPRRAPKQKTPFEFLAQADSDELAPFLSGEHPQTIAVVLAHLPPRRAAEVLVRLKPAVQAEVLRRIAHLRQPDPDALHEVEATLAVCVRPPATGPQPLGLDAAASILHAADPVLENELLANLANCDPLLAARLQPAHRRRTESPAPADLEDLPDGALAAAVSAAPWELVVLALAGSTPELVLRVMRILPKLARTLGQSLDSLGPTRLSDVERAKRELARLACAASGDTAENTSARIAITV
jgi:flagellar motor switch protein FliG